MSPLSKSSHGNDASPAHTWLEEQVYAPKRERTVKLVKKSVAALLEQKERISLASIVTTSKKVDPEKQGVSESAILSNEQARIYYEQHRSWKGAPRKRSTVTAPYPQPNCVKADRDLVQARQRYLRMGKAELVDRLLTVEQAGAEQQERWLLHQDELLQWQLRAEQVEVQLKSLKKGAAPKEKKGKKDIE